MSYQKIYKSITKQANITKKAEEELGDLGVLQHKKHLEQKGVDAAKILASILGGAIGGIRGGKIGAGLGGAAGWLGHEVARAAGKGVGNITGPRTLKEYKEYLNSRTPFLDYFIPGKTGYNEAREKMTTEALQKNKALELLQGLSKKAGLVDTLKGTGKVVGKLTGKASKKTKLPPKVDLAKLLSKGSLKVNKAAYDSLPEELKRAIRDSGGYLKSLTAKEKANMPKILQALRSARASAAQLNTIEKDFTAARKAGLNSYSDMLKSKIHKWFPTQVGGAFVEKSPKTSQWIANWSSDGIPHDIYKEILSRIHGK